MRRDRYAMTPLLIDFVRSQIVFRVNSDGIFAGKRIDDTSADC